jgi:hypothetical protein
MIAEEPVRLSKHEMTLKALAAQCQGILGMTLKALAAQCHPTRALVMQGHACQGMLASFRKRKSSYGSQVGQH